MLILAAQRGKAGAAAGANRSLMDDVRNSQKGSSRGKHRHAKVRDIRQQLADGRYNVDGRVNGVLDKLLEVLIA